MKYIFLIVALSHPNNIITNEFKILHVLPHIYNTYINQRVMDFDEDTIKEVTSRHLVWIDIDRCVNKKQNNFQDIKINLMNAIGNTSAIEIKCPLLSKQVLNFQDKVLKSTWLKKHY